MPESTMAETSDPMLHQRFLAGMSKAACTVTVVTTDGAAGRAGVTVSAMSSVSADGAAPTLLVCVHHRSPAAEAIRANGVFCVNLLREDQAELSDVFAGRKVAPGADKFAAASWEPGMTGAPRITSALASFECRLTDEQRVGTHHVFFGAVQDIVTADEGAPLIYVGRAYGRAARLDSAA